MPENSSVLLATGPLATGTRPWSTTSSGSWKGRGTPRTIRNVYSIVRRVFDAAKAVHEAERVRLLSEVDPDAPEAVAQILKTISLPGPLWDLGAERLPRVEAQDVVKPASTFEELQAMISAVRDGGPEAAYLSLASVYGLRREELCLVKAEHLDFSKKTIFVNTCKGGERRKQLLCDEVILVLRDYGFKEEYSPLRMSGIYHRICAKAGIEPTYGSGWHSPRRLVDTVLVEIFGQLTAHIFLRWKISSSSLMEERYYSETRWKLTLRCSVGTLWCPYGVVKGDNDATTKEKPKTAWRQWLSRP